MPEVSTSKWFIQAGWDDAPHLDDKTKREMLADTPAYMRKARSLGQPSLGSGAIWPVEEEEITVAPFAIPDYWPRCYALDVGWKRTAALWGAWDRDSDVVYLYSHHYRAEAEAPVHAQAIKARGQWIPGVIDPAAQGRSQHDGSRFIDNYRDLGLNLTPAVNAVEAGLEQVKQRLESGRMKVFSSLTPWFVEWRMYRRDENGKIIKRHDHLMDCTRYLVISALQLAITRPIARISANIPIADSMVGY